jgi:hypothetical protein
MDSLPLPVELLFQIVRGLTRNADRVRSHFMLRLCHIAGDQYVTRHIPKHEWSFHDHLLVAAMFLNRGNLVSGLMARREDVSRTRSRFWGDPFTAAMYNENVSLIKRFIQLGRRWTWDRRPISGVYPLEYIVRTSRALEIVRILLLPKSTWYIWSEFIIALCLAIELGKFDGAMTMLEAVYGCHGGWETIVRKALFLAS